ncbi:MAG TPA: hypothetical protein VLJ15_01880 [Gammaproteobacteria bacterium]|nr:hypothetical protein [Gammaproteobacteria bacterium]
MSYITREDGERFIIPSYRDVLAAKKSALLKKEILLLSTNYGQYVALQRKNANQYEAAFSPDPGFLLGETVWHYFKRPRDLIYCEAIPNTLEAILVIVKDGSVYLDGSFPVDSIPDELVVFRTQQNHFNIYIHGDIPLSETPEEGKFSLDASSVESFNVLPDPIFPTLPTLRVFQLQRVDVALKAQGIGVIPLSRIVTGLVIIAFIWAGIMYLSTSKKELPTVFVNVVNPYQAYLRTLASPSPVSEVKLLTSHLARLYTIPGWVPVSVSYAGDMMRIKMQSSGALLNVLYVWAGMNNATVQIAPDGVYLLQTIVSVSRPETQTISPLQQVIAELLDRITIVLPGNHLKLGAIVERGRFLETQFSITFNNLTLDTLNLLGEQFSRLPLVLVNVNLTLQNGTVTGIIVLKALGN